MNLGRRRLVALAFPAAVAACSGADPVLYTIESRPGPTFAAGPKIVMLRDISLASYLDHKQIVRSSEDYKLSVMSNDWWGESLGAAARARADRRTLAAPAGQQGLRRERRHHRQIPMRPSASTSSASTPTKRASSCCLPRWPWNSTGRGAQRRAPSRSPSQHRHPTWRARWLRPATPWPISPTGSRPFCRPRCCARNPLRKSPRHR